MKKRTLVVLRQGALVTALALTGLSTPAVAAYQMYQTAPGMVGLSTAAPASCQLPWGATLSSGAAVTAYSSDKVTLPDTCDAHDFSMTCTAGQLAPATGYASCYAGRAEGTFFLTDAGRAWTFARESSTTEDGTYYLEAHVTSYTGANWATGKACVGSACAVFFDTAWTQGKVNAASINTDKLRIGVTIQKTGTTYALTASIIDIASGNTLFTSAPSQLTSSATTVLNTVKIAGLQACSGSCHTTNYKVIPGSSYLFTPAGAIKL